jgi:hypothetical protein
MSWTITAVILKQQQPQSINSIGKSISTEDQHGTSLQTQKILSVNEESSTTSANTKSQKPIAPNGENYNLSASESGTTKIKIKDKQDPDIIGGNNDGHNHINSQSQDSIIISSPSLVAFVEVSKFVRPEQAIDNPWKVLGEEKFEGQPDMVVMLVSVLKKALEDSKKSCQNSERSVTYLHIIVLVIHRIKLNYCSTCAYVYLVMVIWQLVILM